MQTGIEQVYDGLNGWDQCELGVAEYGDYDVQDMRQLSTARYGLILADVDESLVDPVADASQGIPLLVIFEDAELEDL